MLRSIREALGSSLITMLAISAVSTTPLFAQSTTSSIEGTVTDEKGTPAENVQVVATNQRTGYYHVAYTSTKGRYRIPALNPGTYQVKASHINYTAMTKKDIQLVIGQTAEIDFALTARNVQEPEIVVEAHAPLIDTKRSDNSVTVRPEQILSLPLNDRNFLELATVAPGSKTSTGGRGPVTTGAVNSRFISAYIDGGEFKSDGLGGVLGTSFGVTTNIVPEDAIHEFQVVTSMYKAEYANASNGIINAITNIGGNDIHGTAFSFFRASGLNARGSFEKTKPDFNRQQYGFSIGGPIVPDQTHFFLSGERDNINSFTTVFNGGVQPALEGTFSNPITQNLLLARLSHQISSTNSLDARWLYVGTDNNPGNYGGLLALSNGFNLSFRINSFLASDRWVLGASTVNEFRVHYQRYIKDASPNSDVPEHVYISSGIITGWNANQPQTEDYERLQLRDDVSHTISDMAGNHVLKAGLGFEREPLSSEAKFNSGGVFDFRTDTSALPYQGIIGLGNALTSATNYKYGVYLQDDWTAIPVLTFNLGVRWDLETNMINNDYVNPLAGDTALTNHVPSDYIGNGNRSVDYGRFAPRVGFAWDVFDDHSSVINGGYGIFYDRVIFNIASNELQDGRYNIYTVRFGANAPATLNRDTLAAYVARNLGGAAAPGVTLLPSSVPSPYTQQFSLGVSRQLGSDFAASLNFVHIRGFNEYTFFNLNYQKGIGGPRAVTSRYAGINLLTSAGNSWYTAYELSVSRPYLNDWQLQLSYTLSWADNTFDDPFQGYVFQSSIVRAPSLQDERHRFVVSGLINLPFEFQLSGIITVASPRPVNVTTGTDNNKDGILGDDYPAEGRNSSRPDPSLIANWDKNVDLRVTRSFPLAAIVPTSGGESRIDLVVEAFNVFNWVNYTSYLAVLNQKNSQGVYIFGTPSAAAPAREVQLGARLFF